MSQAQALSARDHVAEIRSMAEQPARRWYYTTREVQIIREHYAREGALGCQRLMPHRPLGGIYQKAASLGIVFTGKSNNRRKIESSEWIDAQIVRLFSAGPIKKNGVAELAHRLDRPRWWISKRAQSLGVTLPRFKEPLWSADEVDLLERHEGKSAKAVRQILSRHGYTRTETSIIVKRKRLGLTMADPDHFTARALAKLMGVDDRKALGWIRRGLLNAKRRGTARTEAQHGDQWWVSRRDLRDFLITYLQEWDSRRVDQLFLVDILAGRIGKGGA